MTALSRLRVCVCFHAFCMLCNYFLNLDKLYRTVETEVNYFYGGNGQLSFFWAISAVISITLVKSGLGLGFVVDRVIVSAPQSSNFYSDGLCLV